MVDLIFSIDFLKRLISFFYSTTFTRHPLTVWEMAAANPIEMEYSCQM